ncbi:cytochrome P450 [Nonomuraea sp. NEAU-A123]|uniref:cytochrome P450 family protein n=1 Tax=Nonomuraea sp. NEAU-A123 TaxID=2839649 RepID=UPI001BE3F36E|nr:cytochrome P450 [Nonomuraea sp. NEAU-A123]MBT2226704.1 cytochrome P450 [Nonomuraea sp. NEAU-A123]
MSATGLERSFDPTGSAHRRDPHPLFHRMRERAPVYRQASPAAGHASWYLTRYADVQRALHDPGLGRQLDRLPDELAAVHRRWENDPLAMVRRNMFNLDPPDHTRLRRLMAPAFGPRTVAALERRVHQVVGELVDGVAAAGDGVDLIEALALPLPILIVAELVGFPIDDRARLRGWSDDMLRSRDAALVRRAGIGFVAYVNEKLDERRAQPGEDLLSQLVRSTEISHAELVSSVFQLLLAGDETTVNLIGNGVLELLRHPDQLQRLRARPRLIDSAVEEVLRFNGPVGHSRPLYALTDLDIGETVIPRGDIVVPVLLAANRDPAVFHQPDVFDIGRTPNRHLGFGHGIHFCLGAALARLQARAAIGALVRRFPGLALAVDPAGLEWTPDLFLHGVRRLPLLLGKGASL